MILQLGNSALPLEPFDCNGLVGLPLVDRNGQVDGFHVGKGLIVSFYETEHALEWIAMDFC